MIHECLKPPPVAITRFAVTIVCLAVTGCSAPRGAEEPALAPPHESPQLSEKERAAIVESAVELTKAWIQSWNGDIDPDQMMAVYHRDNKYVWRGNAPDPVTRSGIQKYFVGKTNYDLEMWQPDVTILTPRSVVVFVRFKDRNEQAFGSGVASLIMVKEHESWKIKYVHESKAETSGS